MFNIISQVLGSSLAATGDLPAEEYDRHYRDATVSIYSKPVDGLTSFDGATSGNGIVHHWVLVVHFIDGSLRTLEGNPDDHGFLRASYKKTLDSELTHLKTLGRVNTSPARLLSISRDNPLNGTTFDLTCNNCQDWACAAAREISTSVGREAGDIPRVTPVFSLTRAMNLGVEYTFDFSLFGSLLNR